MLAGYVRQLSVLNGLLYLGAVLASWSVSFVITTCMEILNPLNIEIKHGFSCINILQVPREVLKTEAGGRGFQHLPRDLANVSALKNYVRSLLLHKNWKHLLHFALFLALLKHGFSPVNARLLITCDCFLRINMLNELPRRYPFLFCRLNGQNIPMQSTGGYTCFGHLWMYILIDVHSPRQSASTIYDFTNYFQFQTSKWNWRFCAVDSRYLDLAYLD